MDRQRDTETQTLMGRYTTHTSMDVDTMTTPAINALEVHDLFLMPNRPHQVALELAFQIRAIDC